MFKRVPIDKIAFVAIGVVFAVVVMVVCIRSVKETSVKANNVVATSEVIFFTGRVVEINKAASRYGFGNVRPGEVEVRSIDVKADIGKTVKANKFDLNPDLIVVGDVVEIKMVSSCFYDSYTITKVITETTEAEENGVLEEETANS